MSAFIFYCPHCSQKIETEEQYKGQLCICPACQEEIVIEDNFDIDNMPDNTEQNQNCEECKVEKRSINKDENIDRVVTQKKPNSYSKGNLGAGIIILLSILVVLIAIIAMAVIKPAKWEYKAVKVTGKSITDNYKMQDFFAKKLHADDITSSLNLRFSDWELVGTITEIETVHPYFGKDNYHTVIKSNTRSCDTILIFKRRKFLYINSLIFKILR